MTKVKTTTKSRDWAIIILFILMIASNCFWYSVYQSSKKIDEIRAKDSYKQLIIINKIKNCIDEGTKPCDIDLAKYKIY